MTIYAYKRCSTNEDKQDVTRQLFGMKFDEVFIEYASGKNEKDRPVFQQLKSLLKRGDEVWFNDLSRAGRNTKDLLSTVEYLVDTGVKVVFKSENLTFVDSESDPMQGAISMMLLTMLSSVNQLFLTQTKVAVKQGLERVRVESPEKLRKTKGTKWYSTFTENRAKGLHRQNGTTFTKSPKTESLISEIKKVITLTGASDYTTLAEKLNLANITTPSNKVWSQNNIGNFCRRYEISLK